MAQRDEATGAPVDQPAGASEWDFHEIVFGRGNLPAAPASSQAPALHEPDDGALPPGVAETTETRRSPEPPTRPVTVVGSVRALAEIDVVTRPAPARSLDEPNWLLRLPDGSEHPLGASVLLGRSPRADGSEQRLVVPDPESGVSRTHARLSLLGGMLTIEDLGSTNGTYLVDEDGVETRCPPYEAVPVPLGWGVDLANVPLSLWAPGR